MESNYDDIFGGIEDANVYTKSAYYEEGDYLVELTQHKDFINKDKHRTFVIEGEILESTNPELSVGKLVGATVVFKKRDLYKTYQRNIKGHVAALLGIKDPNKVPDGVDAKSYWGSLTSLVFDGEHRFAGTKIRVRADDTTTKEGGSFTAIRWKDVEYYPEAIAKVIESMKD